MPADVLATLTARTGRPETVLEEVAAESAAGLIVVGGKHHTALARWLGGSTAHHLVRKLSVPVMIVGPGECRLDRILAPIDLSFAARPTMEIAQDWAKALDADLRFLHAVAPVPIATTVPVPFDTDDLVQRAHDELDHHLWPLIEYERTERVVRVGPITQTIEDDARDWGADLIVLGSHGKGWADRILIGSTTEALLNDLPAALLVIPVSP